MPRVPVAPSAQPSLTIRVELADRPDALARLTAAVGAAGAQVERSGLIEVRAGATLRDVTVGAAGRERWATVLAALDALDGVTVLDTLDRTWVAHLGGLLEVRGRLPVATAADLARIRGPEVVRVGRAVADDPARATSLTGRGNAVALVSDGSAVPGLGAAGPRAALVHLEGAALLMGRLAGLDAAALPVAAADADALVETVVRVAPGFGAVVLDAIAAPACFEVEARLGLELDLPVVHAEGHGVAIVVLAALTNAARLSGRHLEDLRVVVAGLGAAGIGVARLLLEAGVRDLVACDARGALHPQREDHVAGRVALVERRLAAATNPEGRSGGPDELLAGRDALVDLGGAGPIDPAAVARMAPGAAVVALGGLAGPGAAIPRAPVVATGRADRPNHVDDLLATPGVLRGALDARAPRVTEAMKLAAARALAVCVPPSELGPERVLPALLDPSVAPAVAAAVRAAATAA